MSTPEPPTGDESERRWQEQDTDQFAQPPLDDPPPEQEGRLVELAA